jgi:hypothetical protein
MISLARHFRLTVLRWDYALASILRLRQTYCPLEPATSSIALRAAGILPPLPVELEQYGDYAKYPFEHCSSCASACYSGLYQANFYDRTKKGKCKAADFLIKESRKLQQN